MKNKITALERIAYKFNSRSRACAKCEHRYDSVCCSVCNKSFVEGFVKGYKYHKKVVKDKSLQRDKRDEIEIYKYTVNGIEHEVGCTYWMYLFLKLTYGDNGLTDVEYKEYKKHQTLINP